MVHRNKKPFCNIGTKSLFAQTGGTAGEKENDRAQTSGAGGPAGDGFVKKYFLAKFLLKIA